MALLRSFLFCGLAAATNSLATDYQRPLGNVDREGGKQDLIYELKKAEIIPTVIDTFTPLLTVSLFWTNATAEVGNTLSPSRVQEIPDLEFIDAVPELWSTTKKSKAPQLTLAMTDPDAPSRDNPEWSEICHWIATDVSLTKPNDDDDDSFDRAGFSPDVTEVMPYKPPGPPPKTGKHRYVFVALTPKNGTTEALSLSKPGDRQHWGYGKERQGLRKWADQMGLRVVGANFIYSQNDEQ